MASLPSSTVNGNVRLFAVPSTDRQLLTITHADGRSISQFCAALVVANPNAPKITSVSPSSGKVGDTITITGVRFSVTREVRFGSKYIESGDVISLADTQIVCKVPAGGGNNVLVRTDAGSSNYFPFTFGVTPTTPPSTGPGGGGAYTKLATTYKTDDFTYDSAWMDSGPATGTLSGHVFYATIANATATRSIVIPAGGGKLAIFQNTSPAYGNMLVRLNGQSAGNYTPRTANTQDASDTVAVYISDILAAGTYTLELINSPDGTGNYGVVDEARIYTQ